jgi:intron-binding protein aquarius
MLLQGRRRHKFELTGVDSAHENLRRVVLIGDHYQLPPIVKNAAFRTQAHLDQSLFARLIRLGVPAVLLDKQGRSRPEIAALYSWRYKSFGVRPETNDADTTGLGNLPLVVNNLVYQTANAGFLHTFQLINVEDFQGRGEWCPTPFFYQNLGEAEYVVAVYQYMRLLGYPAEKISILTTYNGQTNLIRDIVAQRCSNPIFGPPARITTVDKYQGQQNDYVLLSLVRTESIGHIRDVRRLVVALSRARLGLYVFCRMTIFEKCPELKLALDIFMEKSQQTKLQLVGGESYPSSRELAGTVDEALVLNINSVTDMGVLIYQMVQQSQTRS